MKKIILGVAAVLILLGGLKLGLVLGGRGKQLQALPIPYVVERAELKAEERIEVAPCVPIETVARQPKVLPSAIDGLKTDPGAFTGPSNALFPLNLGRLNLDDLEHGADVEVELVDRGDGVGRLRATVTPKPTPRWEWLGNYSVGLGYGESWSSGRLLEADVRAELVRYRKVSLEAELRYTQSQWNGGDLQALAKLRARL